MDWFILLILVSAGLVGLIHQRVQVTLTRELLGARARLFGLVCLLIALIFWLARAMVTDDMSGAAFLIGSLFVVVAVSAAFVILASTPIPGRRRRDQETEQTVGGKTDRPL